MEIKGPPRELIDPEFAEPDGRIVNTTGDGLLVEFHSVNYAIAIQRAVMEFNTAFHPSRLVCSKPHRNHSFASIH